MTPEEVHWASAAHLVSGLRLAREPAPPVVLGYDIVGTVVLDEGHRCVIVDDAQAAWTIDAVLLRTVGQRVHLRVEYLDRMEGSE